MGKQLYGYSAEEHEYSVTITAYTEGEPDITICMSAHGGGTVGEAYAGNGWDYLIMVDGNTVLEGSDIRSPEGRAAGHAEMVRALCGFLSAYGESISRSGDQSEYAGEYTAEEAAWLVSEYERLSLFSTDSHEPAGLPDDAPRCRYCE